ncbi:MAG: translocation/assembly module TamB domain-containing protein, partial [Myxococcales bacterium]|nr:translocation/assembly module TamB domain-containing protein [Myxococcales bacterium]
HLFDPRAWRALGARVVHAASAEAKGIALDARLLALFGLDLPFRGTADVKLVLGAGASSVTATADVRGITGGAILRGIDVHLSATADAQGTRAEVSAASGGAVLVSLPDAMAPVPLDRWISDPRGALAARLGGTLSIGAIAAPRLLAILGRTDVTSGTIAGTVELGGTLGAPTASGAIDIASVRVAPRFTAKAPPALTRLRVEGGWDGAVAQLLVTGDEEGGGTLRVEARGHPGDVASLYATAVLKKLDIAPLAPFLPGVLAGAGGVLATDLVFERSKLRGSIDLTDGRLPLSPVIGTLRRATAKLTLEESGALAGKLDARLGAGTVALTATSSGAETTIDAKIAKVSPIGALQPVIDAALHAVLLREGRRWTGTATLSRTSVLVPEQTGHELLDAAAPADLIFVDLPIPEIPPAAAAPKDPWLVVALDVEPVVITVPEFAVDAMAGGKVTVSVGDTLGLDGELLVERGSTDLFGHRYRVELGQLVFDGNTDGLLDLKLAHDFPEVTTYVRFAGRLSELSGKEPELTSDPGLYSKGQLLGFFLGGEPGGDPTKQTREAAAGFGAALASSKIGKRLKKYLPVSLDVLRCDPGAGTSGASCTFGTWLTHEIFLAYEQKLDARYDENTGDASVEWHFKPSWVLEVSGGDRNYYGGDVLWRRRW